MSVFDPVVGGYRIFVGDLGPKVGKQEFRAEMEEYGHVMSTWIARNPPGFAFVVFEFADEAERAVNKLHGTIVCGRAVRVEHARPFHDRVKRLNLKHSTRHHQRSRSSVLRRSTSRSYCSRYSSRKHEKNMSKSSSQRDCYTRSKPRRETTQKKRTKCGRRTI